MRTRNTVTLAELKILIEAGERFYFRQEGGTALPVPTIEQSHRFSGVESLKLTFPDFIIEGPQDTTNLTLWQEA